MKLYLTLSFASIAITFAGLAGAQPDAPLQPHPAVQIAARTAGIDPSTLIVGHPASPHWQLRHAGGEHPAVLVARRAREAHAAIDPNTFLVQPPASVAWTTGPAADDSGGPVYAAAPAPQPR